MRKLVAVLTVLMVLSATVVFASGGQERSEAEANEVEVLHWWTSGGEAAALNVLKDRVEAEGVTWVDSPIAGGAGEQAMTTLRSRATAGNPPAAVQFLGFDMRDWAQQGVLADLSEVAEANNWEDVIPAAVLEFAKYEGDWVGAPVNIHSPNWIWANLSIMEELGLSQPTTWEELVAAMEAAEDAGYVGLAHGGQDWQTATMLENLVLAVGGPEFYGDTMNVPIDTDALTSDTMVEVFDRMDVLRGFVDENFSGRDWNLASAMVIEGEALFQIMGDWAKGEFFNADMVAGEDFTGFRMPGTEGAVTFNTDFFAFFEVDEEKRPAQRELARQVMAPEFQIAFNTVKGSIPARMDVSMEEFSIIGQTAMEQLRAASDAGQVYGSLAHGHGAPAAVQSAIFDVASNHFNGQYESSEAAAQALADAVEDVQ
ncbi:MAG: extracellular solute-binding protein [Spirochaetes bacterium]|jgi:glucose/mannose transport system substrate-binding protein|nr:extracellular solute-binding protein [Spirochaetota bacterium]